MSGQWSEIKLSETDILLGGGGSHDPLVGETRQVDKADRLLEAKDVSRSSSTSSIVTESSDQVRVIHQNHCFTSILILMIYFITSVMKSFIVEESHIWLILHKNCTYIYLSEIANS